MIDLEKTKTLAEFVENLAKTYGIRLLSSSDLNFEQLVLLMKRFTNLLYKLVKS